jgi:hypothetical protein
MTHVNHRSRQMKLALLALIAAAALLVSPRIAQRVYAQEQLPTCSANCKNGSCTGSGTCTCTCSFWLGTPTCTCQANPGGGGGGTGPGENMT